MPRPPDDTLLYTWVFAIGLASLATWVYLAAAWQLRGSVLPYEPRRSVPWGAWGVLLAVLLVLGSISAAFSRGADRHVDDSGEAQDRAISIAVGSITQASIVIAFVVAVAVISHATKRDVGLPATLGEACRDVVIGVLACLAAYVPVLFVRVVTVLSFGEPGDHPMIQIVKHDPNGAVFAMALFAAVIVAPVCEELSFRLLLQGWLEKFEDKILGWRAEDRCDEAIQEVAMTEASGVQAGKQIDTVTMNDPASEPIGAPESNWIEAAPPAASLANMPHGLLPIVVSAAMFAGAHVGNSTDPYPLFALAIFLGFIYQRTHRILPSIAAHATFNLISMLLLWRMIFGPTAE